MTPAEGPEDTEELLRLDIPAQPAFVGVARVVVASVATTIDGIADDRLEDLRLAVSEACTNAVEAHEHDPADHRIVLRCTLGEAELGVHIEDSGGRLGPDADGDDEAGPDHQGERGWGLQLIRALVDDVSFSASGNGSAVHLVVRRTGDGGGLGS